MAAQGNDRSFHSTDSGYSFPNDSTEHSRLDEQSRGMTEMIGGKPFLTDVQTLAQQPHAPSFTALDIGCGTGILTTSLAFEVQQSRTSKSAKVYGVDLSPVPPIHDTPETVEVEYIQADITALIKDEKDARFKPDSFDFITHRMLVLGINDWEAYIRNCFSLLKPGIGRIEIQDTSLRWFDITGNEEISLDWKWAGVLRKATRKLGFDILGPERLKVMLVGAGFVDVQERVFPWPCTDVPWEGHPETERIAKYTTHVLQKFFPMGLVKMSQRAGLDETRDLEGLGSFEALKLDHSASLRGLAKGAHSNFYVVTGRKP